MSTQHISRSYADNGPAASLCLSLLLHSDVGNVVDFWISGKSGVNGAVRRQTEQDCGYSSVRTRWRSWPGPVLSISWTQPHRLVISPSWTPTPLGRWVLAARVPPPPPQGPLGTATGWPFLLWSCWASWTSGRVHWDWTHGWCSPGLRHSGTTVKHCSVVMSCSNAGELTMSSLHK